MTPMPPLPFELSEDRTSARIHLSSGEVYVSVEHADQLRDTLQRIKEESQSEVRTIVVDCNGVPHLGEELQGILVHLHSKAAIEVVLRGTSQYVRESFERKGLHQLLRFEDDPEQTSPAA